MRSGLVPDAVPGRTSTGFLVDSRCQTPNGAARIALAACTLSLLLGAATARAVVVPLSTFGSQGSGAGQFQTPVGVGVQLPNGAVYVADSANARVEKFDARGKFIRAWGWGVSDGQAKREVCRKRCQAGVAGSGAGQFSLPTSIAVGNPTGRVYVGDAGNNVVLRFNANGRYVSTIDGSTTPQGRYTTLAGVAVDQDGHLWTADGSTNNIDEFDSAGNFLQEWNDTYGTTYAIAVDSAHNAVYLIRGSQETERWSLTGTDETPIDSGVGVALAVDRQTGNLYVDHGGDVAVYDVTGTQVDSLSLGSTTNSQGLAFHPGGRGNGKRGLEDLYVADAGNDDVTIYGPPPPGPPIVTAEAGTGTGTTTATLTATIVPAGFDTTCTFQYVDGADFLASGYGSATSVPCTPADLGSGVDYQHASANLSGLVLGGFYHFHVIATNSAGSTTGADMTFQAGPGDWAPFFRCPVDDPAMIATDGGLTTLAACLASNSTHGSITIGTTTTPSGNTNLQTGLVIDENTGNATVIAPPGGAVVSDPAQATVGGFTVTAVVESAGAPSNFDLTAAIQTGLPIITLPIKIHLENAALGPSCYIGSDQDPIVLNPQNTDLSGAQASFTNFDPDGTPDPNGPLQLVLITGAVQGDDTFTVPAAEGCGPNGDGSLDSLVDSLVGLPSPSGSNHLVLDDASSAIAALSDGEDGQQFADDWHGVFGTTTTTTTTSTTSTTM